jgi:hypothetical protein
VLNRPVSGMVVTAKPFPVLAVGAIPAAPHLVFCARCFWSACQPCGTAAGLVPVMQEPACPRRDHSCGAGSMYREGWTLFLERTPSNESRLRYPVSRRVRIERISGPAHPPVIRRQRDSGDPHPPTSPPASLRKQETHRQLPDSICQPSYKPTIAHPRRVERNACIKSVFYNTRHRLCVIMQKYSGVTKKFRTVFCFGDCPHSYFQKECCNGNWRLTC